MVNSNSDFHFFLILYFLLLFFFLYTRRPIPNSMHIIPKLLAIFIFIEKFCRLALNILLARLLLIFKVPTKKKIMFFLYIIQPRHLLLRSVVFFLYYSRALNVKVTMLDFIASYTIFFFGFKMIEEDIFLNRKLQNGFSNLTQ